MVQSIIDIYLSIPDRQVETFFHHTGITSTTSARRVASRLLSEGYWLPHGDMALDMTEHFNLWQFHREVFLRQTEKMEEDREKEKRE